jgi:hypothetical protein
LKRTTGLRSHPGKRYHSPQTSQPSNKPLGSPPGGFVAIIEAATQITVMQIITMMASPSRSRALFFTKS